ncbi:ribosome production factor 1-like [Clytia hemisphaerica]|uniref:Brix domain-containing protein n=1 Tax=Clytia hemisphaerica TaxID=252671 RepID=A0A7M5X4F1_9CNID|eukprot:TCONS_00015214-protein
MADSDEEKHEVIERKQRTRDLSLIKNKIRRNELYREEKQLKSKEKKKERAKRKRERQEAGEDYEPPKRAQKTLDNMRVKDNTMVEGEDEEVLQDAMTDEFASTFTGEKIPKVLFTTSTRPKCHETMMFIKDLLSVIPNSEYKYRKGVDFKEVVKQAKEKDYTSIVVVNEDQKKANALVVSHLPDGPTLHFKLSSSKRSWKIKNHGKASSHRPELVLNNFNTRLGHTVGRSLASIFPYNPQFQGRRVVTFHNQRDFIFFRQHRYIFKNKKKVGLQEIGPRFTLKLRSIQKGTFDSKFGEYEWIHKRHEMDSSRRKFHL